MVEYYSFIDFVFSVAMGFYPIKYEGLFMAFLTISLPFFKEWERYHQNP